MILIIGAEGQLGEAFHKKLDTPARKKKGIIDQIKEAILHG